MERVGEGLRQECYGFAVVARELLGLRFVGIQFHEVVILEVKPWNWELDEGWRSESVAKHRKNLFIAKG